LIFVFFAIFISSLSSSPPLLLLSTLFFSRYATMTIKIQAARLGPGVDANAVAGASAGELHELANKLHATVRGREQRERERLCSVAAVAADASADAPVAEN
jgi:hypothetical protein